MAKNKKTEPAIEVKNITKDFILPRFQNNSLKQVIVHGFKKNEKTQHRVLDSVSFTINKGDFFGIVGRNGSGKSTLLKLICGIYTPTAGEIVTHGKITPFIELGVGFNPELSGRDNVYLNGALFGFDRHDVSKMYDEIVEFAELEEFMDLKLKNYSSGMQVRLAFSIAIKSKSPILVFDEVLAVGDAGFQAKCLRQFHKFKKEGRTVVLVTHDMRTVERFCNKVIAINDGKKAYEGDYVGAVDYYNELNLTGAALAKSSPQSEPNMVTSIKSVDVVDTKSRPIRVVPAKTDFTIKVAVESAIKIAKAFLVIKVFESDHQMLIFETSNKAVTISKGKNIFLVSVKDHSLSGCSFYCVTGLYDSEDRLTNYGHLNTLQKNQLFMIKSFDKTEGIIRPNVLWENK